MIHLAFLLAIAEPTSAQVLGYGTNSCGSYVATRSQPVARDVYITWLTGFLTEFNISNRQGILDASAHTDGLGIQAWLDTYCTANPLVPFATASLALLADLVAQERRAQISK